VSPDAELLRAARGGDPASLGAILERYRPRLLAIALRMLGYGAQAEDAVHDTFLIALRKIGTLSDPGALQGWLDAIVRNVCRMILRENRPWSLDSRPPGSDLEAILQDPEEQLDRLAMKDWVWNSLRRLGEPLRLAILLRHFSEFATYGQISELLAIPVGTVRSRLAEGRRLLAESLLQDSRQPDPDERSHRERWNGFYTDMFARLNDGHREQFLDHFRPDMEVVSGRKRFPGRDKLELEVDGDLESGTMTEVVRAFTSGSVSVMDCKVLNPPDDPARCPVAMAFIVCRTGDRSHRIYMQPGPRISAYLR
jgi:RNA polymerase sigma-70 factor (ECF subfamily)